MRSYLFSTKILSFLVLLLLYASNSSSYQMLSDSPETSYRITGLNNNQSTGFIIDTPGYYYFGSDLYMSPSSSDYAGIYINSSDVVLDFKAKSLTASTTGGTFPGGSTCAISIAPNKKNIIITFGKINGGGKIVQGIKAPGGHVGLILKELQILDCQQNAVQITDTTNLILSDVHTYDIAGPTTTNTGLYLNNSSVGIVLNCTFNDTITNVHTTSVVGLYATKCHSINFDTLFVANNKNIASKSTNPAGAWRARAYGIHFDQCTNMNCKLVQVHSNLSASKEGDECAGILLTQTTNCTFLHCSANANFGGLAYGSNSTCSTYGFKLTNSSNNNTFNTCESKGNSGAADTAGFCFDGSSTNLLQTCLSLNNTSSKVGLPCRYAYGFKSLFGPGNGMRECKSFSNSTAIRASNKAYGYMFRTVQGGGVVSCASSGNVGGIGYGIAMLGHCKNGYIVDNKIIANNGIYKYGFYDEANPCTTLFHANLSYGHGRTLNSAGLALTLTGSMNFYFKYATDSTMDVHNLIKETDISNLTVLGVGSVWQNYSILADNN